MLDVVDGGRDDLTGLARGLAVIEAFSADRPRLSIADVARSVGIERATSRRCLLTLTRLGYAAHDGKYFSLTPRVLRLGYAYLASTPLPQLVQGYLDRLSEAVGESASVSILDGTDIVYVARASLRRVIAISLGVGSRLPASCASMGRVMLAALPEAEARALLERSERRPLTVHTKVAVDDLMDELARVRRQGYAIVDEELEIGLRSLAVPIVAADHRVVAALNIGAQASRLSIETMRRDVLPRLVAIQHDLRPLLS